MPGVVVSAATVRVRGWPTARGRKRKQPAARPQLRPAPRRAAAAVLALTCLSAEVQRSGAGWAADSLTSLGVERSRRGTRSPSSHRHGE